MNKEAAKREAHKANTKFVEDLCNPHCPKGLTNREFQCLNFSKSRPWLENEAKGNWEVSKPACLVGYCSK